MARSYYINGNTQVLVDGSELGISDGQITISPMLFHQDIKIDDFGPDVPGLILWQLGEARVRMTLVHFDSAVLDTAIRKSMAGGTLGTMVGGGTPLTSSYQSLRITSPVKGKVYVFPTAFVEDKVDIPVSNERTIVTLTWRAVPKPVEQSGEPLSAGAVLWQNPAQA